MHHDYSDITNLTEAKPKWHDENGVPRYCDFHPDRVANIYAGEAALALVECQGCRTKFHVAFSEVNQKHLLWDESQKFRIAFLSDLILNQNLKYGDPPNTRCCAAGPTMSSIPIAVLEYWIKPYIRLECGSQIKDLSLMNWKREDKFEVRLSKDNSKPSF
jgi:hypothetical protein